MFVGKVMALLSNMLSRLVIALLPRSKRLLILWLQSLSTVILELKKIKSVTVSTFSPSICHEVVLEKTSESPLDCEIKPANPKGNPSSMFIRRTDAEAEAPIFWPPDTKSWFIGKDLDAGKDWGEGEKGMTKDEMVGLVWLRTEHKHKIVLCWGGH